MKDRITIALPKGRIYKECLPLLAAAGIEPTEDPASSRKLVIDTTMDGVEIVVIRGTDVPTYVQHGAADIGVAGKDVLMEHGGAGLNEVLDLQIAKCQLMTAGFEDFTMPTEAPLRVATKFVNCAKQYFAEQSQQIDIIKLYGSMELAPIVGLADLIVDLVDTGNTLKANKLVPMAHIADISSRLVVNSAAMKMKNAKIKRLVTDIDGAISS